MLYVVMGIICVIHREVYCIVYTSYKLGFILREYLFIYHSGIKSESICKQRLCLVGTSTVLSIVMQMRNLSLSNHSEKTSINNIVASYELRAITKLTEL